MMVAIFIILGTFTSLLEGTFIKKYNSKYARGGFLFTALVSLFSMVFFVITDKNGFSFPKEIWYYGLIGGIMYCVASYLTYAALQIGSFALTMLILSYSLVFSIGYGLIFLNEPATIYTYIGLVLIMVSLFLVRGKSEGDNVKFSVKWLIFTFISVVCSGLYGVIQRMQQIHFNNSVTNEFMIIALGFSAITLAVIGLAKDGKYLKDLVKHGGIYAVFAGLSNGTTNMFSLIINTLMPISIATPVRSGTKIVFSFLISIAVFKEKFSPRQIVGVALSGLALIMLNM